MGSRNLLEGATVEARWLPSWKSRGTKNPALLPRRGTKMQRQSFGEKIIFSINRAAIIGCLYAKTKIPQSILLTIFQKLTQIIDLNIKLKTINLLDKVFSLKKVKLFKF